MRRSPKNILTVSVAVVLFFTVLSAVFSYISMAKYFDHDIGHYADGTVITKLAVYLPFAAFAASVVCVILARKKVYFEEKPAMNIPTVFSSVLTGLLMLAASAFELFSYTDSRVTSSSYLPTLSGVSTVAIAAGIVSAVYFVLYPFFMNKNFVSVLSFAPPIWAAFKLLEEYFKSGTPINSPTRTATLAMLSFVLLFFAEQIRFSIGRESVLIYYFSTLNAIAFIGNSAIPKLAVIMSGSTQFDFSFIDCCLGVGIFLFVLSRLLAAPAAIAEGESGAEHSKPSK